MNIAITGGIGAGKSTIIEELKRIFPHAHFYSMDKFVDALYREESWLVWLKERFNTTNRQELSERAFACDSVRAALNSQSALKIGVKLGKVLSVRRMNIVEFPLLFESGLQDEFDTAIHITADTEIRIDRVVARGKKNREQAASVIAAQMPEDKKRTLANYTVDTSKSTPQECAKQIHDFLWEQI